MKHGAAWNPSFWTMETAYYFLLLLPSYSTFLFYFFFWQREGRGAVLLPATCSSYISCQIYISNIFSPVRVRNWLNKLRSGFVLQ